MVLSHQAASMILSIENYMTCLIHIMMLVAPQDNPTIWPKDDHAWWYYGSMISPKDDHEKQDLGDIMVGKVDGVVE